VLPLYPQYASATTASIWTTWPRGRRQARYLPEFRFVDRYGDEPGYIASLAASAARALESSTGVRDMLVMSFPRPAAALAGPRRPVPLRVPQDGAAAGARPSSLKPDEYKVTFQSRFGKRRVAAPLHRADARRSSPLAGWNAWT
jgi:ferrochelatase